MKIIVQAGGVGSRMKELTLLKPKGMVSAKYLPIIFHLFKRYSHDEFIIIGDYKFNVLDNYLTTFATDVKYVLLKARHKGNVAGIKDALHFVNDQEPFMLVWSDIILSDNFYITEIKEGVQVGIVDFPCSWSLINGKLENKQVQGSGVGGVFIFNDKQSLNCIPEEGSFTDWLSGSGIQLYPISLRGSIDVGTLESYNKLDINKNRCRPYNRIIFCNGNVVKSGVTAEADRLIQKEIEWYGQMEKYGFHNIPKIHSTSPLTMQFLKGKNVFEVDGDRDKRKVIIKDMVNALNVMHNYETKLADRHDLYQEYFQKTIHRLEGILRSIPFGMEAKININGCVCENVAVNTHLLREAVLFTLMDTRYGPIHGDCQFTNTMFGNDGNIYFIDARGYFGKSKVLGDVRYDWAKMLYSISGNFDQFNIGNHTLQIDETGVSFSIKSGAWEEFEEYFWSLVPKGEGNKKEIELIHSIIWLSMASHAWENFDSMCIAFYKGTRLFYDWQKRFCTA